MSPVSLLKFPQDYSDIEGLWEFSRKYACSKALIIRKIIPHTHKKREGERERTPKTCPVASEELVILAMVQSR
jgi:hypothetical protein